MDDSQTRLATKALHDSVAEVFKGEPPDPLTHFKHDGPAVRLLALLIGTSSGNRFAAVIGRCVVGVCAVVCGIHLTGLDKFLGLHP